MENIGPVLLTALGVALPVVGAMLAFYVSVSARLAVLEAQVEVDAAEILRLREKLHRLSNDVAHIMLEDPR